MVASLPGISLHLPPEYSLHFSYVRALVFVPCHLLGDFIFHVFELQVCLVLIFAPLLGSGPLPLTS